METLSLVVSIIAGIIAIISGPIVWLVINALFENKSNELIKKALAEERERLESFFANKTELAEVKGEIKEIKNLIQSVSSGLESMKDKVDLIVELIKSNNNHH